MFKYVDLSHRIEDGMPAYPGDPDTVLRQTKSFKTDGYHHFQLDIGMHTGTHIDGPMHLTEQTCMIDEFSLERFAGEGCLLDVRGEPVIYWKEEYEGIVTENSVVLLFTGHGEHYGKPGYFENHPVIDFGFAEWLVQKKVKLLGMDLPSPEGPPFEIHKLLFGHRIFLIENMTNLVELSGVKSFEIFAFPLRMAADSSIARVVARVQISEVSDS